MPEMHLRQHRFTYSAYGPFTKNKERIQKFKQTGDSQYICQNILGKAFFKHDMAYGDFKDLPRRTPSDKVLRIELSIFLKIHTSMDINADLYQWFTNFLIKKLLVLLLLVVLLKVKINQKQLAENLHKSINRIF